MKIKTIQDKISRLNKQVELSAFSHDLVREIYDDVEALTRVLQRAGNLAMLAENILNADVTTISNRANALREALDQYNDAVYKASKLRDK